MNSLAVIFKKPKKMEKIGDFGLFESLWSLNPSLAEYPVRGEKLWVKSLVLLLNVWDEAVRGTQQALLQVLQILRNACTNPPYTFSFTSL